MYEFSRSVSQRRAARSCGQKWLHSYVGGWKRVMDRGSYRFGDTWQTVVNYALVTQRDAGTVAIADCAELFRQTWMPFKDAKLHYNSKQSHQMFLDRGVKMVETCMPDILRRLELGPIGKLDESLKHDLAGVPEVSRPDYYGYVRWHEDMGGVQAGTPMKGVIDFKTSDRDYNPLSAELDEQLSNYQIAEEQHGRPVEVLGLCVAVYQSIPRLQWLLTPKRTTEHLHRHLASAVEEDRRIREGRLTMNPNACFAMGECDYVPLCYPSQAARIETEMVQRESRNPDGPGLEALLLEVE